MAEWEEYKRWNLPANREQVEVPDASTFDDETLLLHLEKRHAGECGFSESPVSRKAMQAWIGSYRAFHARCHKIASPGQHDHYHEEEDE